MEYFHLTIPQQNIWNLQKYYGNTAIGNLCGATFYREMRESRLLQQAIRQFIQNQSGIRLRFCEENGIAQYVSDEIDENIPVKTFSSMKEFDNYAEEFARRPLELTGRFMYRFVVFNVEGKSGILVLLSHLIADAWTFGLMAKQLDEAYHILADDVDNMERISLLKADYIDYIKSEENYLTSKRYLNDKNYWEKKYADCPQESRMKMNSVSSSSIAARRITKVLPLSLEQGMNSFCKTNPVTPAVLFETVLIIYLYKVHSENSLITIGIPVLNRSNAREKETAGMFISTMSLTVPVSDDMTGLELAERIAGEHINIFRHMKYPYESILKFIREKHKISGNLYNAMVSFQNARTDTLADTKWYSNGYSEIPFVLHIDNRDGNHSHTINVDYQTEVFEKEEVVYIIDRLECILEQIIENGNKRIKDVNIVPKQEWKKIVCDFNDTYVEYPKDKCVHELFAEQVEKTPDKIALVFEDKKFTYRQLDEMSDSLAYFLREKGVKPETKVIVLLERDERILIMQLAVFKIGAIFIPVDSRYPEDRIEYIISESNAGIVIKNIKKKVLFSNVCNIEDWVPGEKRTITHYKPKPDDVCYIIFTSGSTGKPKGCMLSNRGIINFCINNNILSGCNSLEKQICVSVNTVSFDFFIAESLLPLLNGFTVVLANEKESVNRDLFQDLIIHNSVNIIQTTPTRYRLYFSQGEDWSYTKQFQVIVSSGEALPFDLLQSFHKFSKANIFNPLGPSECSVWATGGELCLDAREISMQDITIGKPIANTQIYILDRDNNLLPIGIAGELCIAGDGVGKGYLNHPDLTAERFVQNPFATEENHHGKILYHTGDLARWRADGEIEYLGRMDTQVKIRGLRIELGEIENVMGSMEGIGLTAVTDKKDQNNRQYLVGYYTAKEKIDEKKLREHLSRHLPRYMVPHFFMRLTDMPVTPSGKTDRLHLPEPAFTRQATGYVAPEAANEKILCHLLEELLHMERVGIQDDFFELGGDSLTAIEYTAKAHSEGIDFALQNVFDYPTVRLLCDFLDKGKASKIHYLVSDFEKYQRLLDRNVIEESFVPVKRALGNILLTGATGFLGAHVLDHLMREEEGKIYCLVRSDRNESSCERVRKILQYYFGSQYDAEIGNRIILVDGDIEKENSSENMPKDVQTVIHTAASVSHYGTYEVFRRVNVEGTRHMVNYAMSTGARLIHISTLSVSGGSMPDDEFFDETSLYVGQSLDNVYIHSKFEAELVVYNAILEGLDAKVIRVGNLTSRAKDYKFQPNYIRNAFLSRLKAILEFGILPDYLMPLDLEFSPVDLTAEGILKIAWYADRQCVFHLNNDRLINFERFLELVEGLGISVKGTDGAEFNDALEQTMQDAKTEYIFKAFQNDMDEQGRLVYPDNNRIVNKFTVWFLRKVGFQWNEIDMVYMKGYINYFREIGYLKV